MLALFSDEAGLSKEIFDAMLAEGKLQDKGTYIEGVSEQTAEEWAAEMLENITVGLLDTIYAETEDLAVAAYNALTAAERNDSVEVICPVLSEKLIELMVQDHWSMGVCVGVSLEEGAKTMLELADELMETGKVKIVSLEPKVIYSDDVKEIVDSGIEEIPEILNSLMK